MRFFPVGKAYLLPLDADDLHAACGNGRRVESRLHQLMKKRPAIPRLEGGPQTILLAEDVERMAEFYRKNLQLQFRDGDKGRYAEFDMGDSGVLLLVQREGSIAPMAQAAIPGGPAKPITFAIPQEGYDGWRQWLEKRGVPILRETRWVHGGQSLYLQDPDGRTLELKTPALLAAPRPAA